MSSDDATDFSSTDLTDQYHERLDELLGEPVDAETAKQVASLYPDHVVATPTCIEGLLAEELRAVTEFVQTEEVVKVNRETDRGGSPRKVSVILEGEPPSTGPIHETVRRDCLWFNSAGVHEGQLHVRFYVVDAEEVDRC